MGDFCNGFRIMSFFPEMTSAFCISPHEKDEVRSQRTDYRGVQFYLLECVLKDLQSGDDSRYERFKGVCSRKVPFLFDRLDRKETELKQQSIKPPQSVEGDGAPPLSVESCVVRHAYHDICNMLDMSLDGYKFFSCGVINQAEMADIGALESPMGKKAYLLNIIIRDLDLGNGASYKALKKSAW